MLPSPKGLCLVLLVHLSCISKNPRFVVPHLKISVASVKLSSSLLNMVPFLLIPSLSVFPFPTAQQKGTTLSWFYSRFSDTSFSVSFVASLLPLTPWTWVFARVLSGFSSLVTPQCFPRWALPNLYLQPRPTTQSVQNYIHHFSPVQPSPHSPHVPSVFSECDPTHLDVHDWNLGLTLDSFHTQSILFIRPP